MTDALHVPWLRSGTGRTPREGGCLMQVIDWIHRAEWTDHPPCVNPVLRSLAIHANDAMPDTQRQRLLVLAPRLMGTVTDDPILCARLALWCAERVLPFYESAFPFDSRPRSAIIAAHDALTDSGSMLARDKLRAAARAAWAAARAAQAARAAWATEAAAWAAARAAWAIVAALAAQEAWAAARAAARAEGAAQTAGTVVAADGKYESLYSLLEACLDEYDRLTGRHDITPEPLDFTGVCAAMADEQYREDAYGLNVAGKTK